MTINVRSKGQRAERQAIELLQPIVDKCYAEMNLEPPRLQRNTLQSDVGGFDIVGLDWLALEVKHQEKLQVEQWWLQTVRQAKKVGGEPVLMYKQNNVRFRVRLWVSVGIWKCEAGQNHVVDVSVESFVEYFTCRLMAELRHANKNAKRG